jgi:hypothetical protein
MSLIEIITNRNIEEFTGKGLDRQTYKRINKQTRHSEIDQMVYA